MIALLWVGLGGAAGSILRYLCQRQWNETAFPYGTLLVNLAGCLLIGMLAGMVNKNAMSESSRLLLISGFCGGFTTFSSFTVEGNQLFSQEKIISFALYTGISVVGGLLLTFLGYKIFNS